MTSPTFPPMPFPPFFSSVKSTFQDWEKYLQTKPEHYVNVVAFKIVMLAHTESVYGYGYLINPMPGDTLLGEVRVMDEDMSFNPELGWQGGDHFGAPPAKKVAVTAKLATVNGHDQITLDLGTPPSFQYHAALTAVMGKDPTISAALMLTGDRVGTTGGKVLSTFSKESWEKTHWPPQ